MIPNIFCILTFLFLSHAHGDVFPKFVPIKYQALYIPFGFDSNDNTQIVGEGIFQDSCYLSSKPGLRVDHENRIVRIYPRAMSLTQPCLQMLRPYVQPINLGKLKAGSYKILSVSNGQEVEQGFIDVAVATNEGPDDFFYPEVENVQLSKSEGYFIHLSGQFPSDCFDFRDVVVRVQGNVIVIQPIIEQIRDLCRGERKHFSKSFELKNVTPKKYLLHVRSSGGMALNYIVDLRTLQMVQPNGVNFLEGAVSQNETIN